MNAVNKQALLKWMYFEMVWKECDDYDKVRAIIESGRFDCPQMEHENAYWAREGLVKHQQAEIDRLRAALDQIEEELTDDTSSRAQQINRIIQETLSTTNEPTGPSKSSMGLMLDKEDTNDD